MSTGQPDPVELQYARLDLSGRIEGALRAAGKNPAQVTLADLAPLDEFHIGGRRASVELAELAAFPPNSRILDVGAGLGGPARLLANSYRCRVTALDLTEAFCRAAEMLNRATGLDGAVTVVQGSALSLPFDDSTFDGAWTQHASMNIRDKALLYREIRRVLHREAIFALHDVQAGPRQPITYPVPWADTPALSYLSTPEETRELVTAAGFEVVSWRDRTEAALEFFKNWAAAAGAERPTLGVHVYVENLVQKSQNQLRNFGENRLRVIQAKFRAT